MRKQMVRVLATAALLIIGASAAKANTITVTAGAITNGVFNYIITEDAGGRISDSGLVPNVATTPFLSAGTLYDDYFTIYDFVGFTGAHTEPAGWTFISQLVGPTDSNILATDSPTIANLTWYWTGATLVGPMTIPGFSATSTFTGINALGGQWTSEDTQNGGAEDGTTNAATGKVATPGTSNVPDAGSTLLLLGVSLLGMGWQARRRRLQE
jgi:hypothetical protein